MRDEVDAGVRSIWSCENGCKFQALDAKTPVDYSFGHKIHIVYLAYYIHYTCMIMHVCIDRHIKRAFF